MKMQRDNSLQNDITSPKEPVSFVSFCLFCLFRLFFFYEKKAYDI